MGSGERPIGAAKGKQPNTEALCQPPPPLHPPALPLWPLAGPQVPRNTSPSVTTTGSLAKWWTTWRGSSARTWPGSMRTYATARATARVPSARGRARCCGRGWPGPVPEVHCLASGRTHGGGGGGEGGGRHQVGGVSRSPDGLFAQQEREPIRGRPAVRGKRTYGGRPGQRVEEQGTWASHKHSEAGYGRPLDRGVWTANTVKRPRQQPAHPQYANYWAPLTRKRHIPPHPAQPQHTDHWAPRTRKRHQQEHRPQRPTQRSDPTQHAKGTTGDCPGPRERATTRRNVTRGVGMAYVMVAEAWR